MCTAAVSNDMSTLTEINGFRLLSSRILTWGSRRAQTIKNLSTMQETWVRALAREDPLEKGMATHSSVPAWRIPWTEEPGGLQSMDSQRVHD